MKSDKARPGSTGILIGAVIAILALVRGPWQTWLLVGVFAVWGLRLLAAHMPPRIHKANRRRKRRHRHKRRPADDGPDISAWMQEPDSASAENLLLRHVNHRISAYLRSAYPGITWEWEEKRPEKLALSGGTGRIRVYGVPDYEYADVTLDKNGKLDCSMVKVVPVQGSGQGAPTGQSPADPSVWYELEGRGILETLIADLRSRGHSSLTLNEDGSISFQPEAGSLKATKRAFATFPAKVYWTQLGDVLAQEGLTADVQADHIAVSW